MYINLFFAALKFPTKAMEEQKGLFWFIILGNAVVHCGQKGMVGEAGGI